MNEYNDQYIWGIVMMLLLFILFTLSFGQTSPSNDMKAFKHGSPVRLISEMNRMNPQNTVTDQELSALTQHDMIAGADGHGLNFPGIIEKIRELNSDIPVLCYGSVMQVMPDDSVDFMQRLDPNEDAFYHCGDPAGLYIIDKGNTHEVWFRQDARAVQYYQYYEPPGVVYYTLEGSISENGPWEYIQTISEDSNLFVEPDIPWYRVTSKEIYSWYRLKTKLSDVDDPVPYSWPAEIRSQDIYFPIVQINPDFSGCTTLVVVDSEISPEDILFQVDVNHDREFDIETESMPFEEKIEHDVYIRYNAVLPVQIAWIAIRIKYNENVSPITVFPSYNNRLLTRYFSQLVKPDNSIWYSIVSGRLSDALLADYDGIRLDFAYDNIELFWISSALVSDREKSHHDSLPSLVGQFLENLKTDYPDATIMFNGRFTVEDPANYFGYLSKVDGADFEYFMRRNILQPDFVFHMISMLETCNRNKFAVMTVAPDKLDVDSRLKSLALYLLIINDRLFYNCVTNDWFGSVSYFPEYDIPLGNPLIKITTIYPLLDQRGLLIRKFRNGEVYFNLRDIPIEILLDHSCFLVGASGGYSEKLGGDGHLTYEEVSSITLQPLSEAILLYRKN